MAARPAVRKSSGVGRGLQGVREAEHVFDGCSTSRRRVGRPQPSTSGYLERREESKKNYEVRRKLEVQNYCQMLTFRLPFEPISIQIFFRVFFSLLWKKVATADDFYGGIP